MTRCYYFTKFIYGATFLTLIYVFVAHPDYNSPELNLYYPAYAVTSSFFYPFSFKLAERLSPKITESTAWRHGGGLFCILLSIPLGIIYLVIMFSRKN